MENEVENKLKEIVKLYFDGYTVGEAIKKISIKKEPFTEGPSKHSMTV